jgi:phage baseplate assembly protein V
VSETGEILFQLAELNRIVRNLLRVCEVVEVDLLAARAIVVDRGGGPGRDVESDWLPWADVAAPGDILSAARTWRPPAVGSRMLWLSPSGVLANGLLIPAGYSERIAPPAEDADAASG